MSKVGLNILEQNILEQNILEQNKMGLNQLSLIWKNSWRKPVRFTLTSLSVIVAFYLFALLAGINTGLISGVTASSQYRLISSHRISLTRSLPINYQKKIESLKGIKRVAYASWFGGFFQHEKNQLAHTAVSSDNYFEMFPEYIIKQEDLNRWKKTRRGLLIGQLVADKFAWKVGDIIPIQSSIWANNDDHFTWAFEISGIYQTDKVSTDANRVFMQHQYFDEYRGYMRNTAAWFSSEIQSDVNSELMAKNIDELFTNSSNETKTTSEQVFIKEQTQQFVDMSGLLKLVLIAVFFTLILIACNSMMQSVRERMNEIAMMKAIGFSSMRLILNTFLESSLLLCIGAVSGTLLGVLSLNLVRSQLAEFLPGIDVSLEHYMMVILSIIVFAIICSLMPAIQIKRLAISQTLGAKI